VLLGISLLFFGIYMMKDEVKQMLQDYAWFKSILEQASGSYVLAFCAGALLSLITQSTTAAALIAVAFAHAGVFKVEETMMIVFGGNLGSTFSRMLLSAGLKGSSRQIGRFQDLFKIVGSALFVLLFYIEVYTGVPLIRALCARISDQLVTQTALINLFCNLGPAIIFTPLLGPVQRLLDHYWPATEAEDFAKLKYLHPQALRDPESALDLIEKEQTRLLARLPDYANVLRKPEPGSRRTDQRALHQAFLVLYKEVQSYCTGLVHLHLSATTSERLTNVHDRHGVIGSLEETVHALVTSVEQTPPSAQLASLVSNMTEALDFLLATAGEAAVTLEREEADMMATLCADRGDLLGKIRTLYLSADQGLQPSDKALLLSLTTQFDRIVWLVRRLAELLQQNQRFRP